MGEVTADASGLLPRIGSLFNNEMFSDVEFLFLKSNPSSNLYGHKLILALRSDYFASLFYQNKEAGHQIVLPAEERQIFYCLLRFLYTDDIQFEGVDVEDLYALSNQYGVKELASKCLQYLLKERITIDNIFSKYECALSKNIETLLRDCRNFVCFEAESVFESIRFDDASMAVLEDILKQDDLSLPSEMIAINAVLRWGRKKCKKDKLPVDDKNLRECVFPFLKYLRLLTLTATEFQSIVGKYNIFTGLESTLLTCKILQPHCNVNTPEFICSSNQKRGKLMSNTALSPRFSKQGKYIIPEDRKTSVSESRMESNPVHRESYVSQDSIRSSPPNYRSHVSNYTEINRPISSAQKDLLDTPQRSDRIGLDSLEFLKIIDLLSPMKPEKDKLPQSKLEKQNDVPNKAKLHQSSLEKSRDLSSNPKLPQSFQYEIKKTSPFAANTVSSAQYKASRGQSTPNSFNNLSVSNFPPDTENRRTFEFCLMEGPQSLVNSFLRDIKCSVTFLMKSGSIKLHGFELYVRNGNDKSEKLKVDVDLNGFYGSFTNKSYKICPANNVCLVMFSSPVLLEEKGEAEISIDNLYLNRCRVCPNNTAWKLNNGSSCMCDISIKSNQYVENQNGLYFLINRIFYIPC